MVDKQRASIYTSRGEVKNGVNLNGRSTMIRSQCTNLGWRNGRTRGNCRGEADRFDVRGVFRRDRHNHLDRNALHSIHSDLENHRIVAWTSRYDRRMVF